MRLWSVLLASFVLATILFFRREFTDPVQAMAAMKIWRSRAALALFGYGHTRWSYDALRQRAVTKFATPSSAPPKPKSAPREPRAAPKRQSASCRGSKAAVLAPLTLAAWQRRHAASLPLRLRKGRQSWPAAGDIIVYGATGFTGRLVAEYLAQHYRGRADAFNWAMAGQCRKLAEVRDSRRACRCPAGRRRRQ